MKRALAFFAVLCILGTLGFGQAITGRWRLHTFVEDLATPSLRLRTDFLVRYTVGDWEFSGFGLATHDRGLFFVNLGASADVGPFEFSSSMNFGDPVGVDGWRYESSTLSTKFEFGGLGLSLLVWHDAGFTTTIIGEDLGFGDIYPYWSITLDDGTPAPDDDDPDMIYYFKAVVDPVRFDILFLDESTGIEFHQAMVTFKGLAFCCPYTLFFSFTKEDGFDYLRFSFSDLSLLGWSFGIDIEYGLTTKGVTLYPKYGPLDACFQLFGGPVWGDTIVEDKVVGKGFQGWAFHGFVCSVRTSDCSSIGFLTAFNPEFFFVRHRGAIRVFPAMASAHSYRYFDGDQPLPNWWGWYWRDLFASATVDTVKTFVENEVFWFTTCGAGCCGGRWELEVNVFTNFGGPAAGRGLFGITRIQALSRVPIMTNLTVDGFIRITRVDATIPAATPSAISVLGAGLTFTF